MDQLTAHLLTAHEDRDLDEGVLLLLLLTCGVEDAAACLSAPFQFALISWMKRPVFDVFDCSFVPDCFLLQFSLFLCCSIRRSPTDFLERPAKRSGCTVTNSRATQSSMAGCPRRKTPTPFAFACRKRSRISLFLSLARLNRSCFPLVAMLPDRLVTRPKTSQTRDFVLSHSIYHCTRL